MGRNTKENALERFKGLLMLNKFFFPDEAWLHLYGHINSSNS
jgi:hypothetical protein